MASTKAAKIWKRTWVGASIAGGLVLVLWAASAIESAMPVLAVTLIVLAVCIWELNGMGSLAGRRLSSVLAWAAVATGLVTANYVGAMSPDTMFEDPAIAPALGELVLGWLVVAPAVAALVAFAAWVMIRGPDLFARLAAALWLPLGLLSIRGDLPWARYAWFVLGLFLLLRALILSERARRREVVATTALGTLLVVSIPALAVAWAAFDHWGLVALLVIAKLGDTAGYFGGNAFGRHHPFKSISPGKTLEGCLASLAASALAGAACVALGWLPGEPHGWLGGLAGGALVNLAAQASDLLESWVKRRAGVKDSGTWFGPSGGVLDLVDSFFLAAPVALLAWPVLFDFPPLVAAP